MDRASRNSVSFSQIDPQQGLRAALAMNRRELISAISDSGLKGCGGAGFPVGVKWNLAAVAKSAEKIIVCNADEGEVGAFKDHFLLSNFPELVFAGMTIAAYAIGASTGIMYLRGEYSHLREGLEAVLEQRRQAGLLGSNIAGREGLRFDIRIQLGSGAYVCGEETALIESLEGHRGEPRNRPPFPVDTGFKNKPSVVNNVETLCWAAAIMARGSSWFRSEGTEGSPGRKLFSVSGDCTNKGVFEFPYGTTLAELLDAAGGGNAKAVMAGGAGGQCVPASQFSRQLAFEDVPPGGSIVIFGPDRDMLKYAQGILEFFVEESCGQCTPCRIGTVKLLEGVRLLRDGRCSMRYLEELCSLSETMQIASKCGLGQSSPNVFLSVIEHFRNEIMGRMPVSADGHIEVAG